METFGLRYENSGSSSLFKSSQNNVRNCFTEVNTVITKTTSKDCPDILRDSMHFKLEAKNVISNYSQDGLSKKKSANLLHFRFIAVR